MISFVWAEDETGNIGYQGHLPWHLPADLHHFKEKTIGHPIVMGRKTFDSFPRILTKRKHVVLTHNYDFKQKYQDNNQVEIFIDLFDLKNWVSRQNEDISIIGGTSLFKEMLNMVDVLEQTKIHHQFQGDVQMVSIDYEQFYLVNKEKHYADNENKYDYTFLTYKRK